jgi:hypothetical protein
MLHNSFGMMVLGLSAGRSTPATMPAALSTGVGSTRAGGGAPKGRRQHTTCPVAAPPGAKGDGKGIGVGAPNPKCPLPP